MMCVCVCVGECRYYVNLTIMRSRSYNNNYYCFSMHTIHAQHTPYEHICMYNVYDVRLQSLLVDARRASCNHDDGA